MSSTAETCADVVNRGHDFVYVLRFYAKGDCVYSGKFVKEHALAFHNRHACFGTYVAKSQNRASVGDDRNGVPTPCERVGQVLVVLDCKARRGNSRRVGEGQILLVFHFRS